MKPARVERKNLFDRHPVLHARYLIALVVIHVRTRHDQNRLALLRDDLRNRPSQRFERREAIRPQYNRNKLKIPRESLQERQLNFERMLSAMGGLILAQ